MLLIFFPVSHLSLFLGFLFLFFWSTDNTYWTCWNLSLYPLLLPWLKFRKYSFCISRIHHAYDTECYPLIQCTYLEMYLGNVGLLDTCILPQIGRSYSTRPSQVLKHDTSGKDNKELAYQKIWFQFFSLRRVPQALVLPKLIWFNFAQWPKMQ